MTMLYDLLFHPFVDYGFMRRALAACFALSLGCGPVGVFLMLRRMSLMGDAMSHAILPGAAVAFMLFGLSLWPMTLGGFIAGLLVALLAGLLSRATLLKEDASFAALYLISLAAGVLLISLHGSTIDLMHVLFGNILAAGGEALVMVASIASLTLLLLALIYRPLIMECFDPGFLRSVGGRGAWWHMLFVALVVLNLVAGFQALGTLMALGLMILPAAAANFWSRHIDLSIALSIGIAFASGWIGLLISYHANVPSGPAIVLTAGAFYILSVIIGSHNSLRAKLMRHQHLKA
jgi:zinc/manganese transport system permease protein